MQFLISTTSISPIIIPSECTLISSIMTPPNLFPSYRVSCSISQAHIFTQNNQTLQLYTIPRRSCYTYALISNQLYIQSPFSQILDTLSYQLTLSFYSLGLQPTTTIPIVWNATLLTWTLMSPSTFVLYPISDNAIKVQACSIFQNVVAFRNVSLPTSSQITPTALKQNVCTRSLIQTSPLGISIQNVSYTLKSDAICIGQSINILSNGIVYVDGVSGVSAKYLKCSCEAVYAWNSTHLSIYTFSNNIYSSTTLTWITSKLPSVVDVSTWNGVLVVLDSIGTVNGTSVGSGYSNITLSYGSMYVYGTSGILISPTGGTVFSSISTTPT